MNLDAFFRDYIFTWEDGGSTDPAKTHSLDPKDNGNWTGGACGQGVCVGSNHGVTAAALARYRGLNVTSVTQAMMHALSLDEAAAIGEKLYYHTNGLDLLPWDAVMASVVDFGWGAGPGQAVKLLQRMIGANDDGQLGMMSVRAYAEYVQSHGIEAVAKEWQGVRDAFYRLIVSKRPVNAKYLGGWMRRSAYFAPGTLWWKRFNAPAEAAA